MTGGAYVLKGWPWNRCYQVSMAHLEHIWAPRVIIICDPENMHQRQFTGNLKKKKKQEDRVGSVNMYKILLCEGDGGEKELI